MSKKKTAAEAEAPETPETETPETETPETPAEEATETPAVDEKDQRIADLQADNERLRRQPAAPVATAPGKVTAASM